MHIHYLLGNKYTVRTTELKYLCIYILTVIKKNQNSLTSVIYISMRENLLVWDSMILKAVALHSEV